MSFSLFSKATGGTENNGAKLEPLHPRSRCSSLEKMSAPVCTGARRRCCMEEDGECKIPVGSNDASSRKPPSICLPPLDNIDCGSVSVSSSMDLALEPRPPPNPRSNPCVPEHSRTRRRASMTPGLLTPVLLKHSALRASDFFHLGFVSSECFVQGSCKRLDIYFIIIEDTEVVLKSVSSLISANLDCNIGTGMYMCVKGVFRFNSDR